MCVTMKMQFTQNMLIVEENSSAINKEFFLLVCAYVCVCVCVCAKCDLSAILFSSVCIEGTCFLETH